MRAAFAALVLLFGLTVVVASGDERGLRQSVDPVAPRLEQDVEAIVPSGTQDIQTVDPGDVQSVTEPEKVTAGSRAASAVGKVALVVGATVVSLASMAAMLLLV